MEWEKSPWSVQAPHEPLGLSEAGRSVLVSSMPLKGTVRHEASCQDAVLG
jgi:hypothetical protein